MKNNSKTTFTRSFKNTRLDEIEVRIINIVRLNLGEADKQQQLFNLAKELGLPIDSSDVYSRRLSYTEMFDRLNDWIKSKRAENHTRRTVCASWISAITAMLAVIVSFWIHWQTRQLLAPSERPIISTVDSKCTRNVNTDTTELEITLRIIIKNVGKHPAEKIRLRVWGAPVEEPNNLKMTRDVILADPIFPDIQVSFSSKITIQLESFDRLKDQKKKVFFYVRMDYRDAFLPEKDYTQNFHIMYEIGKGYVSGATLKEKERFESHLKKAGAL